MKPKLSNLDELFEKGEDFELTDSQYEKRTGCRLPKDKSYLLKKSALAKECKKRDFILAVVEKRVILKKKKVV